MHLVASNYPEVKYSVLVEFIWTDINGEGSVFQMISNCSSFDKVLDFSSVTIVEADENLVPYVPYSVSVDSKGIGVCDIPPTY